MEEITVKTAGKGISRNRAHVAFWTLASSVVAAVPFVGTFTLRENGRCFDERGQGTTEYAILVGVLVVMAILAISLFRPHLQEIWDSIAEGINGL